MINDTTNRLEVCVNVLEVIGSSAKLLTIRFPSWTILKKKEAINDVFADTILVIKAICAN